jgi:hypothetical protein
MDAAARKRRARAALAREGKRLRSGMGAAATAADGPGGGDGGGGGGGWGGGDADAQEVPLEDEGEEDVAADAGGSGERDIADILASLRGESGRRRLRLQAGSAEAPPDTSAATRYALTALQAASEQRAAARRQAAWDVPVPVPGSGGRTAAVRVPARADRHIQDAAVAVGNALSASVLLIHRVRDGMGALDGVLTATQRRAARDLAALSVTAYALSRAPTDGIGAAEAGAAALTGPMLGVSAWRLRRARSRVASRGTALTRMGAHERPGLFDDPAFAAAAEAFMRRRFRPAQLKALHLYGTVPSPRAEAGASTRPTIADLTSFLNWAHQDAIAAWRLRRAGGAFVPAAAAAVGGSGGNDNDGGGGGGGGGDMASAGEAQADVEERDSEEGEDDGGGDEDDEDGEDYEEGEEDGEDEEDEQEDGEAALTWGRAWETARRCTRTSPFPRPPLVLQGTLVPGSPS